MTMAGGTAPLRGPDRLPARSPDEPVWVTRFAPSPTGYLHLGHAYSALYAWEGARASGGAFRLRIEDIDPQRCRPEFERAIYEDLRWLGLQWDGPVLRQSDRLDSYARALADLRGRKLVYPCFCTRSRIRAEVDEAARAPHGPSGEPLYPGTCRGLPSSEAAERMARGEAFAWRLNVAKAVATTGPLHWHDLRAGHVPADPEALGDVVVARKDIPTSYHLAVTVDDHAQGVTLISRGEDLFHATHAHRLLQALLGLRTPQYYHHNLIADSTGQRMSKRNRAVTLRHLRERRQTPDEVWALIGLSAPASSGSS